MQWFKGKLFVGTNRAWRCFETLANIRAGMEGVYYPPADPDLNCAADPADLPLAAEIWAWTPSSSTWERVYQSPIDVPYPGRPGRWLPRDVGFRGMSVFVEADGTEALYVSGVTAAPMLIPGVPMPPPRLLRSVAGDSFAPVPQDIGTTLGSLTSSCLRGHAAHAGKFYVTTCDLHGGGEVLESSDPKLGNNSFRRVTPAGLKIFEIATFNGRLYAGTDDAATGYSVLSAEFTETAPFSFRTVVPPGASLTERPNTGVLSMQEFNGRLYVGGNGLPNFTGSELIRINPSEMFDVVVGAPRLTPRGWKRPLSGLSAGFGSSFNQHIWRMESHDGRLYAGTLDASGLWKDYEPARPSIAPLYGFDLMQSGEGWYFSPVTRNGFGDRFAIGARSMASTPEGLFVGSANSHYGLQVLLGAPRSSPPAPPQRLEIDSSNGNHVLSWAPVSQAVRYHVLRSRSRKLSLPTPAGYIEAAGPEPFVELATVTVNVYVDAPPMPTDTYYYVVVAETASAVSSVSNLVQAPSPTPPVTIATMEAIVGALDTRSAPEWSLTAMSNWLADSRAAVEQGNIAYAIERTRQIRLLLFLSPMAGDLLEEDLEIMTAKLLRRLYLAQGGLISAQQLL